MWFTALLKHYIIKVRDFSIVILIYGKLTFFFREFQNHLLSFHRNCFFATPIVTVNYRLYEYYTFEDIICCILLWLQVFGNYYICYNIIINSYFNVQNGMV